MNRSIRLAVWSFLNLILMGICFPVHLFSQDTSNGIIWYPAIQISDSMQNAYEPKIALTGDDTVHITWEHEYDNVRLPYVRSITGGTNFSKMKELLPDSISYPYHAFRPMILTWNYLVWIFFTGATASDPPIHMIKSSDAGFSWSQVADITVDVSPEVSSAAINNNNIALVFPPNGGVRKILRSTNEGISWTRTNEGIDDYAKVALTPGNLHLVQNTVRDGTAEIEYRRSGNLGTSWNNEKILSTIDRYWSDLPAIAGYTSKCGTELLVAWRDGKYGWYGILGASILGRTGLNNGELWLPEQNFTDEPRGSVPSASISQNVRAIIWKHEITPADTFHVAIRASNSSVANYGPMVDLTPDLRQTGIPSIAVSKKGIHAVYELYNGSTFRIFYRRGEFIQKDANFSLSVSYLEMDTTEIGRTTTDTVRVMNTGSDTLIVGTAISDNENFSVTPGDSTVAPLGEAIFKVHYTPKSYGSHTGKIIFYHNGRTSPDCFDLSGVGTWRKDMFGYQQGQWNLLSIPLKPSERHTLPSMFAYEGGYVQKDTMLSGTGYWAKPGESIVAYTGSPVWSDTFKVKKGWNMIGSLTGDVLRDSIMTLPDSIITSSFYNYSGSQYLSADTIKPGHGYWIKVNADGKLYMKTK